MANGFASNLTDYLSDENLNLPSALNVETLARQVSEWLTTHDGATFNLFFGNMAGQVLYAVSLYPERSAVIPGRTLPVGLLRQFIEDNRDLLADPRNSIGIWYSDALQAIYLDVSATLPDMAEAVSLGEWYNQEAIYDLGWDEVLDTGGTGEWREGWSSESNRLSPLHRQQEIGKGNE